MACTRQAPPATPAEGGAEADPIRPLTVSNDAEAQVPTPIVLCAAAVVAVRFAAAGSGAVTMAAGG